MKTFESFYERAVSRHGEEGIQQRLNWPKSSEELCAVPDDRYLALMTKRVFAAGFRWKVIEAKFSPVLSKLPAPVTGVLDKVKSYYTTMG